MEENHVCWQCGSWFIIPPAQRNYYDSGLCGLCELKSIPSCSIEGLTLGRVVGEVGKPFVNGLSQKSFYL